MTDDLVKWLREEAVYSNNPLFELAADCIEQQKERNKELEAALQLYKDGNHLEALKRERAALGEKKE